MARVRIIFNPAAARTHPRSLEVASSILSGAGWEVEIVGTTHPDEAGKLAREGVDAGADVVAVNGGDGTIAQAIGGILGRDVPLAILPGGTGNQLARNLGIPWAPDRAARVIIHGCHRRIDVGEWRSGDTGACFAVACGAGFDAQIVRATTSVLKRRLKMTAYVTQGVVLAMSLQPTTFRLIVDGEVTKIDAATVLVANCARIIPPYRPLRAGISTDDGLLDVVTLNAAGLRESLSLWYTLACLREDPRRIRHLRGSEIRVESHTPVDVQRDGEVAGTTPFTARVLPGALEVLVPESM